MLNTLVSGLQVIYDLLERSSGHLELREDPDQGITVAGLKRIKVPFCEFGVIYCLHGVWIQYLVLNIVMIFTSHSKRLVNINFPCIMFFRKLIILCILFWFL